MRKTSSGINKLPERSVIGSLKKTSSSEQVGEGILSTPHFQLLLGMT